MPPLPGPGLEVPVDVDGDGVASFGDAWVFNRWLELGGSLQTALEAARLSPSGDAIDLSAFFASSRAALSPDAPIAQNPADPLLAVPSSGPGGQAAQGQTCSTSALPATPGGQAWVVLCDQTLLEAAAGQVMVSGTLYVTRRSDSPSGGVSEVVGFSSKKRQPLPLDLTSGRDIATGICQANKLALDPSTGDLLLSASKADGCAQPGRVIRIHDPSGPAPTLCDEVPPGDIFNPNGIAVVEAALDCLGAVGDVVVADDESYTFPTGSYLATIALNGCDPLADKQIRLSAQNQISGIAMGDFDGTFGIYYAQVGLAFPGQPAPKEIRIAVPERLPNGHCSWDAGTPPPVATLPEGEDQIDALAFDPFTGDLFATNSSKIWRISPPPGPGAPPPVTLFAGNLAFPGGISFTPTGLMLVSEGSSAVLTAIGGWRNSFIRGDADGDGRVLINDPSYITNWLFLGGPEPGCWDAADANDDGGIDLADAVYVANHLYSGGPPPPPPYPAAGVDPTPDLFDCGSSLFGEPQP